MAQNVLYFGMDIEYLIMVEVDNLKHIYYDLCLFKTIHTV